MLNWHSWGDRRRPAIVLLHGFMGSGQDWQAPAERLAERYYLLAPDLPGHGQSRCDDWQQFRFEQTILLLGQALVERLTAACTLVGYSMGGRMALALAAQRPALARRLVLESTSPGIDDAAERRARQRWDESMAERLRQEPLAEFLAEWYQMPLFDSLRQSAAFEQMLARRLENDGEQLALSMRYAGSGAMPSLWPAWRALTTPTLLIAGSKDAKYRHISREMATSNRVATRRLVADAGHNVHLERPEAYVQLLQQWLGGDDGQN